jgi:hypothetical protein
MSRNDTIEISVMLHADPESALAILVSDDGEEEHAVWLPRSQIEYDCNPKNIGREITVTLPEWLAADKGLI